MSAKDNPVVGAMIRRDGKLVPVAGADPSAQWTYRAEKEQPVARKPTPPPD